MRRKISFIMAIMLMMAFTVTGCKDAGTKSEALIYKNYIEAVMDCSYHGETERYLEVVDAEESEAKEVYEGTVEYYAVQLMEYNAVSSEYISEDLYNKYVELAGKIMAKTKYNVNEATKVNGEYQVKIEIYPVDINDISYDDIEKCINDFEKQLDGVDTQALSDEEWAQYEEAYGENVYNVLSSYVDKIGYKDVVSKIVIIQLDEDGNYGLSEEEWYDIDDYVVDMK